MRHNRVKPVDAIWLDMDRVRNLMVIECVMFLEGPIDRVAFDRLLRERLIGIYPVFSRIPVKGHNPWSRSCWHDVPDLDLERHVREVRLPAPGDAAALQTYVSSFMATPLPRDRPLWEVHLVTGLDEGAAIYVRLHHALADGIALTQVLISLTETSAATGEDARDAHAPAGGRAPGADTGERVGSQARGVARSAGLRACAATVRTALRAVGVVAKLMLTRNPPSPLEGPVGAQKQAVWSEPVELQLIKDIAKASDATVNDVLVSALAGAVRRYQVERGAHAVDLPTMIPVSLRPLHLPPPPELGNRFAVVLLLLPSGVAGAAERLAETKRRMDKIKRSPEPVITFAIISGIGRLGRNVSNAFVTFFAGKATGVTTNVPGPREPRYLAGTRVTGLLGWVPGSATQTLGTCIFTYDGMVTIGLKTDAAVVPDPLVVLEAFRQEITDLSSVLATPKDEAVRGRLQDSAS
ncbi:wax ester/triacylglycerol synthase family O-acyltransferase [Nocardioides aurantiacus]|uniref:wax ester/triacylglycerol synthase family O-acyltransferase n=1 Tax=Nocardioides aurantiacus TaxID=86796 RepID=UPI00147716D1|nr:wax ester/triacylglycerol synthase family O-acyltransferase [Nocardioides aurantiacus]